jgi:hypothetical protein
VQVQMLCSLPCSHTQNISVFFPRIQLTENMMCKGPNVCS